jgi:hypothetical protein
MLWAGTIRLTISKSITVKLDYAACLQRYRTYHRRKNVLSEEAIVFVIGSIFSMRQKIPCAYLLLQAHGMI